MIALTPGVRRTAASICSGSMLRVSGSMSTSTGLARLCSITWIEEQKVMVVATTASPSPIPRTASATCRAEVAELRASAAGAPTYRANSDSKRAALGPVVIHPSRKACTTSSMSSVAIIGGAKDKNSDRIRGSLHQQPQQVAPHRGHRGQQPVASGGQRAEASGQGWNHGHAVQLALKTWEQLAHACGPDPAHIPIGRAVVPEVVPEQAAAGPQDAPDLGRHIARHRRVEDGGEEGERKHQIKAAVGKLEVLGIPDPKVELGKRLAGGIDSFRQEVDPDQSRRGGAQVEKVRELAATAAADLEHPSIGQRQPAL